MSKQTQTLSVLYKKFTKGSDKPEKVFINGELSIRYGDQLPTKLRFITHDDKVYLVCTGDDGFQTQFEIPISERKFVKKEKEEKEEGEKEEGEKPRKQKDSGFRGRKNYRERRSPKEKEEEPSEKKESSEN